MDRIRKAAELAAQAAAVTSTGLRQAGRHVPSRARPSAPDTAGSAPIHASQEDTSGLKGFAGLIEEHECDPLARA